MRAAEAAAEAREAAKQEAGRRAYQAAKERLKARHVEQVREIKANIIDRNAKYEALRNAKRKHDADVDAAARRYLGKGAPSEDLLGEGDDEDVDDTPDEPRVSTHPRFENLTRALA